MTPSLAPSAREAWLASVGSTAASSSESAISVANDSLRRASAARRAASSRSRRAREARFEVTRQVLEAIIRVPGLRVGITTKSTGIVRDVALLTEIAKRSDLIINVSLTSMDAALLRRIEPRAPRPDLRIEAMAKLVEAGVPARLFAMPILPFLTDAEHGLRALFAAARQAGAREAIWNVLFLRGETHGFFLEFIAREFPDLSPRYRALYGGGS